MNILDENIPEGQREILKVRRVSVRKIGFDLGRLGMKDREIISLLHGLDRPTFFSLDADFYQPTLCHMRYCLVYLNIQEEETAEYVRRLLRFRELNTRAKRLGMVLRVSPEGLSLWRIHAEQEAHFSW